jgi:PTS system mannose-specific IIC component
VIPTPVQLGGLMAWGTVVGLDLVSAPQGLLSRPIVAATVAGWIMGNLPGGLVAGMTLELYALDVLPIGASRYPDYSVAAVASGVASALAPDGVSAGMAGLVGLPLAALGGWTLQALRRRNALSVHRRLDRVSRGDGRAIWELQRNGFLRDGLRSFGLSALGIGLALPVALVPWQRFPHANALSWAVVAGGIAATFGGAMRSAGAGARRRWLGVGLVVGLAVVLLR